MLFMIVNPTAGQGRARKIADEAGALLTRRGIPFVRMETQGAGHGGQLAKEALGRGATRILCISGDGTAREVAGQLLGSDCVLSLLPGGTGNDFVRCLGLPSQPMRALEVQLNTPATLIDACTMGGHVFINAAGVGFDVDVLRNTELFKKRLRGMLPYLLGILRAIIGARGLDLRLVIDGVPEARRVLLITVANGRYIGGGMCAAPLADPADGLFDLMLVGEISRLQILRLLPKFVNGSYMKLPFVKRVQCRTLTVSCPGMCLEADGELIHMDEAVFSIHPGALRITAGV